MLVIKVWCLPRLEEAQLNQLHQSLIGAVVGVPKFGVKDEKGVVCLFPSDMMQYGLGEEVIVEVTGVKEMWTGKDTDSWNQLAARLGHAIRGHVSEARVECFVYGFRPTNGHWSSDNSTSRAEVKRICVAIESLTENARVIAKTKCFCEENQSDHKGACHHHNLLGAFNYYQQQGANLLEVADDTVFSPLADVYVDEIRKSYLLQEVRSALGWESATA